MSSGALTGLAHCFDGAGFRRSASLRRGRWSGAGDAQGGDAYPVEVAAEAVLSADPRRASQSRRGRSERFLDIVARSLPDLGEHDVRRVAGLLRVLGSVQTWLRMREEYGLDGAESGPLVIWAVKVLEREIRAGHLPEPPS